MAKVRGLKELGMRLKVIEPRRAQTMCARATGKAAQVVKKDAKRRLRANSYRTGNLHDAVIVKRLPAQETQLTAEYIVTVRRSRSRSAKVSQAAAHYGHFLEFGTVKMPAEPFLGPSLKDNVDNATRVMQRTLAAEINKAGR